MTSDEIILQLIIASIVGVFLYVITRHRSHAKSSILGSLFHTILKSIKFGMIVKTNGAYKMQYTTTKRNKE